MSVSAFDVRTAFLVLAIVGLVQALGSWIALRASVGGPLTSSQRLWVSGSLVAACMGLAIGLRGAPAPAANLLTSHALMLTWLGLCWTTLQLERGRPARWRAMGVLLGASLGVYLSLLLEQGEAQATAYPALVALGGSLLVARQAFALHRAEHSRGAWLVGIAFCLTGVVLLIRGVHLLASELPQTSVSSGLSQVLLTVGGISVFVLGNLGYLGLQIERLTAQRLQADVRQALAEERSVQAQERVRVLQELVEERDLLIRRLQRLDAVQQQAVLAAALPHELRQPLGAMRLNLDALARSLSGQDAVPQHLMEELDQGTQRLSMMIEEFMTLVSPPAGAGTLLARQPVDIGAAVQSAIDAVAPRARLNDVQVEMKILAPVSLQTCALTLHHVLMVLLTNALDAVSDQPLPRQVVVELTALANEVQVRVSDNGPGIAEHLRPHLFQPFSSSKAQGLGIGLVLARRLAQRCGADLSALPSGPGPRSGATFVIHLAMN